MSKPLFKIAIIVALILSSNGVIDSTMKASGASGIQTSETIKKPEPLTNPTPTPTPPVEPPATSSSKIQSAPTATPNTSTTFSTSKSIKSSSANITSTTASIVASMVTTNSITWSVTYINPGVYGDRLEMWSSNTGWVDVSKSFYTQNGTYTVNSLSPGNYMGRLTYLSNGSWVTVDAWVTVTGNPSTPKASLTKVSVTNNSITWRVSYPQKGASGNRLEIYSNFYGWMDVSKANTADGDYTVKNLQPGQSYTGRLTYYDSVNAKWVIQDLGVITESSIVASQSGSYEYDVNGRINIFKSNNNIVTSYRYDRAGNLLGKNHSIGYIDSPSSTDVNSPYVSISGWALDSSGVESIKVYVDNIFKGNAIYGDVREDVFTAYPAFSNHKSGFHFNIVLANEIRTSNIKVVSRNKAGSEVVLYEKNISLKTIMNPIGYLDTPVEGSEERFYASTSETSPINQLKISGWYLDPTPIKSISMYVDDQLKSTTEAITRVSRPDVSNLYPQYNDSFSGFVTSLPMPRARNGRDYGKTISYQIKIVVENTLGKQTSWTRTIKVYYENPLDPGSWT